MTNENRRGRTIGRREWLKTVTASARILTGGVGAVTAREKAGLSKQEKARAQKLLSKIEQSSNPDRVWAQMSKADLDLVREATKVREKVVESTESTDNNVSSMASGCKTITTKIIGKSYIGKQWGYFLETDFCYDGNSVTSKDNRRWPELYGPSWSFVDHVDEDEDGAVGTNHYQYWTQGEFNSNAAGMEWDTAYPWLEHDVYGDGSWDSDGDHGKCNNC